MSKQDSDFWKTARRASREVALWPDWKREAAGLSVPAQPPWSEEGEGPDLTSMHPEQLLDLAVSISRLRERTGLDWRFNARRMLIVCQDFEDDYIFYICCEKHGSLWGTRLRGFRPGDPWVIGPTVSDPVRA